MRFVLLGTGCPQCDPERLGPANLVRHGATNILVDCGSGATQRLVAAGTAGRELDAVFLTHLHSDHLVDLFQLVMSSWHQGRQKPQRVFGPPGTRKFCDGLLELWKPEIEQRIAHEKRPSAEALRIETVEIEPGRFFTAGDLACTAVAVNHLPVKHAFGFVFQAGGKTLVFSGDTAPCPALVQAARGADVLVHECFIHGALKPAPGLRSAEGIGNLESYHTLSDRVGKIAAEAGAKMLVLNHFVPTKFDRQALAAEVRRDYKGPIIVGEDLMEYDLATGCLRYGEGVIAFAP